MNIKDDLEKLMTSNDFGDDVIKQVIIEQDEATKKLQILKVVAFADRMENVVSTDLFTKDGIEVMRVNSDYDDNQNRHIAEFHLVNQDEEVVASSYDYYDHEQAKVLYSIFKTLHGFDFDLATEKLQLTTVSLDLKPGIKKEILNFFLNKDLKYIYDCSMKEIEYNKMNSELTINDPSSKRLKM
jgi:hypothetical protein